MEERRNLQIILAGFGGQGLLFAGKVIASAGLIEDRQLSWLPSYGPEMRGGTANCSVVLADEPIGSPLVTRPDALIAMNRPSLAKFQDAVAPGGIIIIDSALVPDVPERTDVEVYQVPGTQLAEENGLKGLSNIILTGKLWAQTHFCARETLEAAVAKCVPPRKQHLLEPNLKALALGMEA